MTGAGISVESGIPPFRGKGGLWEKFDPMEYAHIDAFIRDPAKVWKKLFILMQSVMAEAKTNDAHKGLYRLEQAGILKTVITQNVDGLHQKAGSSDVIEFHGTFAVQRCMQCGQTLASQAINMDQMPPQCGCSGILRPDVVMFGEPIPVHHLQRAQNLAASCDVMVVVGTSATVEPAAYLPMIAKHGGATIIEINAEPTPLTGRVSDVTLLGKAGPTMNQLIEAIEKVES